MRIINITPTPDKKLIIVSDDGRVGEFDVTSYLQYEVFEALNSVTEFMNVSNGGYFVAWGCGTDLSADTLEAQWKVTGTGEFAVGKDSAEGRVTAVGSWQLAVGSRQSVVGRKQ